jgi:hypothetical protein
MPRLPFPPQVIGIAGASGSGKTTLAAELARELDGIHFPLDNYYFDLSHLPPAERAKENFDDPALIESSLLAAHVSALTRGESIERPLYDFSHHIRIPDQTERCGQEHLYLLRDCLRCITQSCSRSTRYACIWIRRMTSASIGACGGTRSSAGARRSRCAGNTKRQFALRALPSCGPPRRTQTW